MKEVIIDGITYIPKETDSPIKIVILQRSWAMIGRLKRTENDCILTNASIIRKWGTTRGLGELALEGKKPNTILDYVGTVQFDYLTVVAAINCDETKWPCLKVVASFDL